MSMTSHVRVSIAQAREVLTANILARVACALIGAPGVGKTAIVYAIGKALGLPVYALIGSTLDPTDVGGIPVVIGDNVVRVPLRMIREVCDKPGILFVDELQGCAPSVQSALMRVFHERQAGDYSLHPESSVVAAFNPEQYAPGASGLAATTVNRQGIYHLIPSIDEFRAYLNGLDGDETEAVVADDAAVARAAKDAASGKKAPAKAQDKPRSALNMEAREYSAILSVDPRLVAFDAPQASIDAGMPWPSPRAIEKALRAYCKAVEAGISEGSKRAVLAGWLGEATADALTGIKRMRNQLPSIDEVCASPDKARLPDGKEAQVAALGLLTHVADKNTYAAYIYCERLTNQEIRVAAARMLATVPQTGPAAMQQAGWQAWTRLLASVHKAFGGVAVK
jgi:hypothetical protein